MEVKSIGVDIGGSYIKAGVVNGNMTLTSEYPPVPTPNNGPKLVRTVRNIITEILAKQADIAAICIASCGIVSPYEGLIHRCLAIPDYEGTNWYHELKDLGVTVRLENDGHVAAWAEYKAREEDNIDCLVHVVVGTGLGCGIVVAGKLWRGEKFMAGEFGHSTIDISGPICSCGNVGCLELFASGRAIERFMQTATNSPIELWRIRQAELKGDPLAHLSFQIAGEFLGQGLVTLVHLLNPSVISLGGGVVMVSPTFIEAARRVVFANLMPPFRSSIKIEKSRLGNKGGILGGALLAITQMD